MSSSRMVSVGENRPVDWLGESGVCGVCGGEEVAVQHVEDPGKKVMIIGAGQQIKMTEVLLHWSKCEQTPSSHQDNTLMTQKCNTSL